MHLYSSLKPLLILNSQRFSGTTTYCHVFSFDASANAKNHAVPEFFVLNYEYGSSGKVGTRPPKNAFLGTGGYTSVTTVGMMTRGEYLYVKWRIKDAGKIFEDKVDLTQRLPADMTNHELNFAIFGSQLYVFLFPSEGKSFNWRDILNPYHPRPRPDRGITWLDTPYAREHQIYPDIKK